MENIFKKLKERDIENISSYKDLIDLEINVDSIKYNLTGSGKTKEEIIKDLLDAAETYDEEVMTLKIYSKSKKSLKDALIIAEEIKFEIDMIKKILKNEEVENVILKNKREREIVKRYEILEQEYELYNLCEEFFDIKDESKIFYNTNSTKNVMFKRNFLDAEEKTFNDIKEIKKLKEELNFKNFVVISFYQENGYIAAYYNGKDNALKTKCNNFVKGGSDGFYYVLFYNEEKTINKISYILSEIINNGIFVKEIYDNKVEDYTGDILFSFDDMKKYKEFEEIAKEKYGIKL